MTKLKLATAVVIASSLAACGGDHVRTVTVRSAASPPEGGDAILIETRIVNAERHQGKVVQVSVGESAVCQGGTSSGASQGPTITTTLHCPGGTLKLQYAPTQNSLVQGAVWGIVSGTGRFKGRHGGGSMVAAFEKGNPDAGREIFTGTVRK